ncbi:MAG: translocation/assembly module TamB domain-containing protein [Bdellovibrionales bacterium]|nr:translocation/assembly module TamB domain-containing protein [Bdellovibrionales bacterium]
MKALIETQVSKEVKGKLSIGVLDLSFFPPSIRINDIYFESRSLALSQAEISKIRIDISPRSLISETLQIDMIEVENPKLFIDFHRVKKKKKQKETIFRLPSLHELVKFEIKKIKVAESFFGIKLPGDIVVQLYGSAADFESKKGKDLVHLKGYGHFDYKHLQEKIDSFELKLSQEGRDISVKEFDLAAQGLSLHAKGKILPLADLQYKIGVNLSELDQKLTDLDLFGRQQFFEGMLLVEGKLIGSLDHPELDGRVSLPEFGLQGGKIYDVSAMYHWKENYFEHVMGKLRFGPSSQFISFEGKKFGTGKVGKISVSGNQVDYTSIQSFIDPTTKAIFEADIDVMLQGELGWSPLHLSGQYQLDTSSFAFVLPDLLSPYIPLEFEGLHMKGPIAWNKNRGLYLDQGKIEGQGLSGIYRFDFIDVDRIDGLVSLDVLQAGGLFSSLYPAQGQGKVNCKIDLFERQNFEINIDIDLEDLQYAEKSAHTMKGNIIFTRNHVSIPKITLADVQGGFASFLGEFELSEDQAEMQEMKAFGELKNFDASWISELASRKYPLANGATGLASGVLKLESHGQDFNGELKVKIKDTKYRNVHFDTSQIDLLIDQNGVVFRKVFFGSSQTALSLSGQFFDSQYKDFEWVATQIPTEFFSEIEPLKGFVTNVDASGSLQGDFENPKVSVYASLYLANAGTIEKAASLQISGTYKDLKVDLVEKDQRAKVSASLSIEDPYRMTVDAALNDFPLLAFIPETESFVSGQVHLQGEFFAPTSWEGQVSVEKIGLKKSGLEYALVRPVHLDVRKGLFSFSQIEFVDQEHRLSIRGVIDTFGSVEIDAQGEFPLFLLSLIPFGLRRAEGFGEIDFSMRGELSNPISKGKLYVTGGYLQFEDLPKAFEAVEFFAVIDQNRLVSDDFQLEMAGGSFKGRAMLSLDWDPEEILMNVSGNVESVQWDYPEWIPVTFSGDLSIEGQATRPLIRGDFLIHEGLYRDQWDWKSEILSFQTEGRTERVYSEEEESFRYDLQFQTEGDQFRFKNDVAEGIARGSLQLIGSNVEIGMVGRVEVIEGKVVFLSNEFELEPGIINFTSENEIRLDFDLNARTRIQQTDILLDIRTDGDQVVTFLSSQPLKDESTIVALLTLGIDSSELAPTATPDEGLSSSLIPTMLSGPVQTQLEKGLRKIRLIDSFQFAPYFSEETKTTGLKLIVVKNIFPKVKLLYSTDLFESATGNTFSLQQDLNRNLSVQGSVRDNKQEANKDLDVGIDFEFRVDF